MLDSVAVADLEVDCSDSSYALELPESPAEADEADELES